MTYDEFLKGTDIIESILDKKMKEQQLKTYYLLLQDIEINKYIKGLEELFKDRIYTNIPSPAEIREYCLNKKSEHIIAADKIRKAIANHGSYATMIFDDPIIHVVIEKHFGDWIKLCEKNQDELENFFKFEFEKLYKAYAGQKHIDITLILKGRHDAKNEKIEGYEPKYVRFIGEKEKALKWQRAYTLNVLENRANNKILEITKE